MSFTINNKLSFLARFQFLSSSVDSLVKNLRESDFKYLSQDFDKKVLDLVKQKEFYTFILENFKDELSSKRMFHSSLTNSKIIYKDYEHILNIVNKFGMKTMKDDHGLYLKSYVLLLVDVFEKCRNNSLKNCGLCPSHYLSAPGLRWNAMLKMKKIELELIRDPDM